jgi:hypothetical protein
MNLLEAISPAKAMRFKPWKIGIVSDKFIH